MEQAMKRLEDKMIEANQSIEAKVADVDGKLE